MSVCLWWLKAILSSKGSGGILSRPLFQQWSGLSPVLPPPQPCARRRAASCPGLNAQKCGWWHCSAGVCLGCSRSPRPRRNPPRQTNYRGHLEPACHARPLASCQIISEGPSHKRIEKFCRHCLTKILAKSGPRKRCNRPMHASVHPNPPGPMAATGSHARRARSFRAQALATAQAASGGLHRWQGRNPEDCHVRSLSRPSQPVGKQVFLCRGRLKAKQSTGQTLEQATSVLGKQPMPSLLQSLLSQLSQPMDGICNVLCNAGLTVFFVRCNTQETRTHSPRASMASRSCT